MEQQFFKAISDEEHEKTRAALDGITGRAERDRDQVKASYARRLTERLAALQRDKVKP